MNDYIKLLQSQPILRRLSTVQLIAYFGAWFSNVAIYTLLLNMNVSAEVIGFTAMLHFLSGIIQAPFSGSIIDSVKPKKLLLSLLVFEIFTTLFLIFVNNVADLWLLYILVFLKMAAASFYFTTEMSLLPKILDGKKLQKANEIHSIIWSFSYTLGMALSGFVVFWFGVKVAFMLDASMFVVAFYILYKTEIDVEFIKTKESFAQMIKDTFRYLKRTPRAMHLMLLHSFVGFTAFDALVALMVDKYYASIIATSLALGMMHTSRAIGLVIGPMLLSKWANNKKFSYFFLSQALAIWLWAYLMRDFYTSLFASVFVGLFTTTLWSYTYTLLQQNIDSKYYGRIVAYNDMLFLASATFTSFMIGFLATKGYSLEFITFLIGFMFIIGALYFRWIIKNQDIKDIKI
ncbi:MAG: MFS transporter [Sulfurimonas sp.]|jgi:MFS family permease